MYYSNFNKSNPPKILIVELDGINEHLYQMQYETGMDLYDDGVLNNIIHCLENEQNAIMDTEYYLLHLSSKCHGATSRKIDALVKHVLRMAFNLHLNLKSSGVYQNGILPYRFANRRFDNVCLYRKDIFINEIKMELYKDGLYDITKDVSFEHARSSKRFSNPDIRTTNR